MSDTPKPMKHACVEVAEAWEKVRRDVALYRRVIGEIMEEEKGKVVVKVARDVQKAVREWAGRLPVFVDEKALRLVVGFDEEKVGELGGRVAVRVMTGIEGKWGGKKRGGKCGKDGRWVRKSGARGGPESVAYLFGYIRAREVMRKIDLLEAEVGDQIYEAELKIEEAMEKGEKREVLEWKAVVKELGGEVERRVGVWERKARVRMERAEKRVGGRG